MTGTKILELRRKVLIASVLISIGIAPASGQQKSSFTLLEFRYGFHSPLQDMKDRFGANSDIGAGINIVSSKSKLFIGADGTFLFGNSVKEDVLAGLRTFDGTILGVDGLPGDINLKERGYYLGIHLGKFFPVTKNKEDLTGIRVQLGAGLLQHKIRIQDNFNSVIALRKENRHGYDRLTNGPALHVALGFQYQYPESNFRFSLMGDLYGARTQSRRDFDNATGMYLSAKRTDILAGVTIAYIVYISRNSNPDQIYY